MTVTFAFLHHLLFVALFVTLSIEMVLLRQTLTIENARRLLAVDGIYGASAGTLLVVGLLRVFFFEKGFAYYWASHAFLTKFGVFVLVGILSIIPTVEFLKWRKSVREGKVPDVAHATIQKLRKIIHWELTGLALILFFAAWMAKGRFY
jgi:putative membrane protein